jgi:hypothetical protein
VSIPELKRCNEGSRLGGSRGDNCPTTLNSRISIGGGGGYDSEVVARSKSAKSAVSLEGIWVPACVGGEGKVDKGEEGEEKGHGPVEVGSVRGGGRRCCARTNY